MKRVLSILTALIMIFVLLPASTMPLSAETSAVWDGSIATGFASGAGTQGNPYIIETAPQLAYLASSINAGSSPYNGKYYKLANDIVLNDTSNWENWGTTAPANRWTPIGNSANSFFGVFDGCGHTISGIYINTTNNYQGLFGNYGQSKPIQNLGVIKSYIKGNDYVGGVAGNSCPPFNNCYNTGTVIGNMYVGGVAGYTLERTLINCYNAGTIIGSSTVGGVAGYVSASYISDCYNTGAVSGSSIVGGVAGASRGTFSNSYNSGTINGSSNVGGIAGTVTKGPVTDAAIINCYNKGSVDATSNAGGISGNITSSAVDDCYNAGIISGDSNIGGIAGSINAGYVKNCYNTAPVNGSISYVGGMTGNSTSSTVCFSYNTGLITGNNTYVGSIAGTGSSCSVINCYYLSGTAAGGINGADIAGKAEALTSAQMKSQENFIGWDFAYEWFLDAQYRYDNSSEYPQLQIFGDFSSVPSSAVWSGLTDTVWAGSGSEADPFLITSAEELAGAAERVFYSPKYFKLTTDIILNRFDFLYWQHGAKQWTPIGNYNISFQGIFDGDGHTVSGIYINTTNNYQGLFGYGGSVMNLGVVGSYIKGNAYVGGLSGSAGQTVSNCFNEGTINGCSNVGGLVGLTGRYINNCYNKGAVSGNSNVGGIAGYETSDTFTKCYNKGQVSGNSNVGGIAGYVMDVIGSSYNEGTIIGNSNVGGLAGNVYLSTFVGSSYNVGTVSGDSNIGGVAGYVKDSTVKNCYNIGTVNGNSYVGGAIGNTSYATVNNCYYLSTTAAGGINGSDVTGKAEDLTDDQMRLQSSFVNWNFDTVWEFGGMGRDYNYPNLISLRTARVLTVIYQYIAGNTAAETTIQNLLPGETYSVTSPAISGYRPDIEVVSGTMGEENITVTVTYTIPGLWDGSAATSFASGSGTEADPYIIETAAQLAFLASSVNSGTTCQNKFIKLGSDIVLNDTSNWESWSTTAPANSWISIGTSSHKFMGTFNGDGHIVSGVYINTTDDYQGLFGYAEESAIGNLGVIKSFIKGGTYVGGIVGYSGSMISDCYNTGTVKGNSTVGGVAGKGISYITNCFNTGVVTGTGDQVGGLTGYGTAENCYNTGAVSGISCVGGITGYLYSDIVINCYNTGTVGGDSNIGGVAGYVDRGVVINCYYLTGSAAGGIKGINAVGQAEALTGEQMKQKSNFVGWDFEYEWFTDAQYRYDNSSEYPQLQAFGDFSSIPSGAVWNGTTDINWTGSGIKNDPYFISSAAELAGLAETVNSGVSYSGIYFKLTTDIVLNNTQSLYWQHNAVQWNPIGNLPNYFKGIFDGDGHTVSGIYINSLGNYKGLFGAVNSGTIKNIRVIESRIKGTQNVGGISGIVVFGTINNCSNAGKNSGRVSIGGVMGYANQSIVINCNNTGTTTGGSFQIGGVVGNLFSGTVGNCCNAGMIMAGSGGGLAGYIDNNSIVDNCYNTGIIKGVSGVGGLAGNSSGTVKNSYNTGVISGYTEVGGIVGGYYGTVRNCYNTGAISGILAVGGVAGYVSDTGNVSDCYNTGTVSGDHNIGGVAGTVYSFGTVGNCYSVGTVSGSTYIGGVAGYLNSTGSVSNCYYLSETATGGINGADIAGQAELLTDIHMRSQTNFVNWDFETVWEYGGIFGNFYYPTLLVFRIPVTGVILSDESATLGINTIKQLTATIFPANASYKNVTWSSSDSTVASVSSSGLVTALKQGKAVITVTANDGGFTDTCTIIAVNAADEANYSYTISANTATVTRYKGTGSTAAVPSHLGGCPVTVIGSGCFADCTTLVRVYIPQNITAIAADAFSGCMNLQFVYFWGNAPEIASGGAGGSGDQLSASPLGEAVTVYYRAGTTGWDNAAWNDKAVGIVPGDINGDGDFNMIDAVAFVQRLAQGGAAIYTNPEFVSADIVRDGAVNMIDIVKMVQALANPSIVLV